MSRRVYDSMTPATPGTLDATHLRVTSHRRRPRSHQRGGLIDERKVKHAGRVRASASIPLEHPLALSAATTVE
jgi:hypothetical protein